MQFYPSMIVSELSLFVVTAGRILRASFARRTTTIAIVSPSQPSPAVIHRMRSLDRFLLPEGCRYLCHSDFFRIRAFSLRLPGNRSLWLWRRQEARNTRSAVATRATKGGPAIWVCLRNRLIRNKKKLGQCFAGTTHKSD